MQKGFVVLLFLSALLVMPVARPSQAFSLTGSATSITAVMVVNDTNLEVNKPFNLSVTIANSWYWKLYNISFSIQFPQEFSMISAKNPKNGQYDRETIGERVNISVDIFQLGRNSSSSFSLVGKMEDDGEFSIDISTVTLTKVRGPIEEKGSVECAGVSLTIETGEEKIPVPPEGDTDLEISISVILIILPVTLLVGFTYGGKRKVP
ncbi:MAG: hypothetical protein GWO20_16495 [Candidatus Korarchaeota archaeon]|nr:hypothetical protein [Candidatus Korarchaeota archaeon]NIU85004.1 hypothetical protein [Candidatus Thorarchaeota archaeon]NIW15029.1 hypothetical protein [Candidatus Thorarchaeota archaeon]NIW53039.1 hypothetical protein [Candidatus Korarchaeota archaeon]